MKTYPKKFVNYLKTIKAKRPKTVIEHILKHGYITSEQLKEKYGYNHPPRAIRDVREHGVPIITYRVVGSDGRNIGAYKFGNIIKTRFNKISGRTGLSKIIKDKLIKKYGCKCFIYLENMDAQQLQIDHRIPFEISGESKQFSSDDFMLLSGSANRAKSWTCEHCQNWLNLKKREICLNCYWAYPEDYKHIAMLPNRRVDLLWQGDEVIKYEELKQLSQYFNKKIPQFIKEIIEKAIRNKNDK